MKKLIFYTGLVLFSVGVSSADCGSLIIPIALVAVGLILMKLTKEAIE